MNNDNRKYISEGVLNVSYEQLTSDGAVLTNRIGIPVDPPAPSTVRQPFDGVGSPQSPRCGASRQFSRPTVSRDGAGPMTATAVLLLSTSRRIRPSSSSVVLLTTTSRQMCSVIRLSGNTAFADRGVDRSFTRVSGGRGGRGDARAAAIMAAVAAAAARGDGGGIGGGDGVFGASPPTAAADPVALRPAVISAARIRRDSGRTRAS